MTAKRFYGCRIHFKNGGADKVVFHKTIEESDKFFSERVKQFKIIPSAAGEPCKEYAGYYEDNCVVVSKEDIEFPD